MQLREILKIDESPYARELRHAVAVVDQLHRFPKLPTIPVLITKGQRESGGYIFRIRPAIPISINISVHADSPALTLLHEVGHLLDHLALNPIKQGFGSVHDALFDPFRHFLAANRKIGHLTKNATRPATKPKIRAFLRYQLQIEEVWARTYLQWVVTKSDDLLLRVFFDKAVAKSPELYWEEEEMNGIMPVVDQLFSEAGLR